MTISTGVGNQFIELYNTSHEHYRRFPYFEHKLSWDHSENPCYYVGNKQGGSEGSHKPVESIIEGDYAKYNTGSLFGTNFEFSRFEDSTCETTS